MTKSVKSTSIIGEAEGPTSIFITGQKEKNIFKRLRTIYINKKYRFKRRLAAKSIVPNPHTIDEVIEYIKQRYDACEADESYPHFKERKRGMKMALIQRKRPELLGGEKHFAPPADLNDIQVVKDWQRQIDDWFNDCQRKTDLISNETFPTDYHLFIIRKGDQGTLEVETETVHSVLSISWSGSRKVMNAISKDIYLYYGVSQKDIDKQSERYKSLLTCLCS